MRARSALAALTLVVLAGCSPIDTTKVYNPGDGVLIELGDSIQGDNMMFVSDGEQAILLGAISNVLVVRGEVHDATGWHVNV